MEDPTIYIAGPLFSIAEQNFNQYMAEELKSEIPEATLVLPQEYAKEVKGQDGFLEKVFDNCLRSIDLADAVLCILDGPDVDSGTCVEMGYAYAIKKPILGVRSDFRSSEDRGVNLMVSHVCSELLWLPSLEYQAPQYVSEVAAALRRMLGI